MIKHLASAGLCLALVFAAAADTGANDVSKSDDPAAERSAAGLDTFVETAIRGGLLVANEPSNAEGTAPAGVTATCAEPYLLDFSAVQSLRRFTELPEILPEDSGMDARAELARDLSAALALGLYSEANAMIAFAPESEWVAIRKFIQLMENRTRPDLAYFEALAACHPEAELWLAVAQMAVFETAGIERLAAQTARLRALPYTLREDVALLVTPALLVERREDVGQQILALFTPDEIENSTRLNAMRTAVIDMSRGSESSDRLVMLMSRPQLKLAALLILVERDETLRPTLHSFVLEEAWTVLETNETQHDLDPIVAFVINNLASDNLFAGLERVRTLPVADREDVRASINQYTMRALDGYLLDENPSKAINALQTLDYFHSELPLDVRGNQLRKQGAQKALELGLFSMVKHFLAPVEREPQVARLLAEAAFWSGEDIDLFDVRAAFPDEAEINRMAGIRALQSNLPNIATAAFSGLTAHPSKQLELLEHGAVSENWSLWTGDWAQLVSGLTDSEVERLDRVRTIEQTRHAAGSAASREIKPYQIVDLLEASRQRLSRSTAGATYDQ